MFAFIIRDLGATKEIWKRYVENEIVSFFFQFIKIKKYIASKSLSINYPYPVSAKPLSEKLLLSPVYILTLEHDF